MSELSKIELKHWKNTLKEGVFFMVGVEVKNQRKATYINICRFANGVVPSDKHMMHQGHLAGQLFFAEFMKCCADKGLEDAPESVIEDLLGGGKLFNYITDLFVHAYWKFEYGTIHKTITNWDQWKGVLDSVAESQETETVEVDGEVV